MYTHTHAHASGRKPTQCRYGGLSISSTAMMVTIVCAAHPRARALVRASASAREHCFAIARSLTLKSVSIQNRASTSCADCRTTSGSGRMTREHRAPWSQKAVLSQGQDLAVKNAVLCFARPLCATAFVCARARVCDRVRRRRGIARAGVPCSVEFLVL